MTQEDKELLLKDLCARLPYGVKCYGHCFKIDGNHCECYGTLDSIKLGVWYPFHLSNRISINNGATYEETFSEVKPYLFPLSSMTEKQNDSWRDAWFPDLMTSTDINYPESEKYLVLSHAKSLQWLYENHFDVNGLIEKGLAIDATGLNIY